MPGMAMPQQTWYAAAAGYLGMWMAMMVPMMLPSLIPMLSHYRRSVRGANGIPLHGLTALVGAGYFALWAVFGAAAYAAGVGVMAIQMW
jgi:predicted metal-binding membrane protein